MPCRDFVQYRQIQEAVKAVATGFKKNGEVNYDWLDENVCFAKLAHRLIRIHERV